MSEEQHKYDELVEKYKDISGMEYPSCGIGWYDILDELLGKIHAYLSVPKEPTEENLGIEKFTIDQIKEKFGSLRFYTSYHNSYISDLISEAEKKASKTCEDCGSTKNIGRTNGWVTTCCKKCYNSNKSYSSRKWNKI